MTPLDLGTARRSTHELLLAAAGVLESSGYDDVPMLDDFNAARNLAGSSCPQWLEVFLRNRPTSKEVSIAESMLHYDGDGSDRMSCAERIYGATLILHYQTIEIDSGLAFRDQALPAIVISAHDLGPNWEDKAVTFLYWIARQHSPERSRGQDLVAAAASSRSCPTDFMREVILQLQTERFFAASGVNYRFPPPMLSYTDYIVRQWSQVIDIACARSDASVEMWSDVRQLLFG